MKNRYGYLKKPPLTWTILDTLLKNDALPELPETWPAPLYSDNISGIKKITLRLIYPFTDTIPTIHVTYNKIDLLVINDSPALLDSDKEAIYKEKFDIVIINNTTDSQPILKIREVLRPQYMIVFPPSQNKDSIQSVPNIISPKSNNFVYTIFIGSKKRLHIQEKMAKN